MTDLIAVLFLGIGFLFFTFVWVRYVIYPMSLEQRRIEAEEDAKLHSQPTNGNSPQAKAE